MKKPELIVYPHPTLGKKARLVQECDDSLRELLGWMREEIVERKGLGIAAPQMGVLLQCFCVRYDNTDYTFVNPRIVEHSREEDVYEEGCLSIPGVYAEVRRPVTVVVEALDEKGKSFSLEAQHMLARIIQHEYDHLQGILFIDRIPKAAQRILLREYANAQGKNESS